MYRSINSNCRPLVQGGRAVFTGDRHRLGPCLLQAILGYGGMTRIATLRLPGRRSQGLPPSNSIAFPATVSLAKHTSVRQNMTPNTTNGKHFQWAGPHGTLLRDGSGRASLVGNRPILGEWMRTHPERSRRRPACCKWQGIVGSNENDTHR